jgi:putative CocE/NonD family hydrolase
VASYARAEDLTSQFRAFQKHALNFHSEPFEKTTEVAGHIRLTLFVQADAPDFDLWAQLLVVFPDGSAVHLGEDIRRARFRRSPFRQELLEPKDVVDIPFEFLWTARRIPAGARLRLTVAPLNSPNYQKNYNSGGRMGYETLKDARTAHIRIFHDGAHSSRLVLPLAAPSVASAP